MMTEHESVFVEVPFFDQEDDCSRGVITANGYEGANAVTDDGKITLDHERRLVVINREEVKLTKTEFKLLHTLEKHLGAVLSRDVLQRDGCGYKSMLKTRTVDTHMNRLRGKMGEAGAMIKTVRGFGYRMDGVSPGQGGATVSAIVHAPAQGAVQVAGDYFQR